MLHSFTDSVALAKLPVNSAGRGATESVRVDQQENACGPDVRALQRGQRTEVALLTGGDDKPYVFGLVSALVSTDTALELLASDELDLPEFRNRPQITLLNLWGDLRPETTFAAKLSKVSKYYLKLIHYAARAKPRIFHILWNNKFELFDRTALMLYYKLLGKRIVLTAHNVNKARRDSQDTLVNRFTLRIQYHLSDHIFVHTEKMKRELIDEFAVKPNSVTVIPFGINNSVPVTPLTSTEAKRRLGIRGRERTILFYGRIAQSKGLEYLVAAFRQILKLRDDYRLIIAGRPDNCENYWKTIQQEIDEYVPSGRVVLKADFIPDEETEVFFKAADVLVLPYRQTYQSGVLFLAYNFGLPVLAADVGSLKDDIIEGKTGFIFKPEDPEDLAEAIEQYFSSALYANLGIHREEIRDTVAARHSWDDVAQATTSIYARLLRKCLPGERPSY